MRGAGPPTFSLAPKTEYSIQHGRPLRVGIVVLQYTLS